MRFHAKLGSSFRQHHVAGLEVPVDDASLVRGREGIGDLDAVVEGLVEWQLAGWPRETSNGACFPSERARLSGSGTQLATSMHGELVRPDFPTVYDVRVQSCDSAAACGGNRRRSSPRRLRDLPINGKASCRDGVLGPSSASAVVAACASKKTWTDAVRRMED